VALDPAVGPQPAILAAIARAGGADAAQVLMDIADKAAPSVAGIALGLLESMGTSAESFLEKEAVHGRSPAGRETAIAILRRFRTQSAVPTFKAVLHDPERNVRLSGAIGLAELGINDGEKQLRIAVTDKKSPYYLDVLVGLSALQDPGAIHSLKALITGSNNVVKTQAIWAIARSGNAHLKSLAYESGAVNTPARRSMFAEKMLNPQDPADRSRLYAMLSDINEMSALLAADRLYNAGFNHGVVDTIRRELNSNNEQVRHYAIRAASKIPALLPVLATRSDDADLVMKSAALNAIMKLHQTAKFHDVEKYFTGKDRNLSLLAAKVLVDLNPKMAHSLFQDQLESKSGYVRLYSAAMLLTSTTTEPPAASIERR